MFRLFSSTGKAAEDAVKGETPRGKRLKLAACTEENQTAERSKSGLFRKFLTLRGHRAASLQVCRKESCMDFVAEPAQFLKAVWDAVVLQHRAGLALLCPGVL